ncbi:hypothetical protein EJ08DRAFT_738035 [Tothia fuscella]|uniref:Uncharacterized protein n=1 Tax=Tothia fuscella TaxID=1048955 RepID=A0A9P4TUG4_9PEZI|nr:hypothetical protein EJ08DRAFT_738035 [Tothia fuscella]
MLLFKIFPVLLAAIAAAVPTNPQALTAATNHFEKRNATKEGCVYMCMFPRWEGPCEYKDFKFGECVSFINTTWYQHILSLTPQPGVMCDLSVDWRDCASASNVGKGIKYPGIDDMIEHSRDDQIGSMMCYEG